MVTNGMPVLWISINLANLRYSLVICFASIEHELSSNIQSAFYCKTTTMNLVAVAKFFYIICNVILISLFVTEQIKKGLLGSILNFFATIRTNGHRMLHFHCLIWLKSISHLATLQF